MKWPQVIDITNHRESHAYITDSWVVLVTGQAGEVRYRIDQDEDLNGTLSYTVRQDGAQEGGQSPGIIHNLLGAVAQCEREYLMEFVYRPGKPEPRSLTLDTMRWIDPKKAERLLKALSHAKAILHETSKWEQPFSSTVQELAVRPILMSLGFCGERMEPVPPLFHRKWLLSDGEKVALVDIDSPMTRYDTQEEGTSAADHRHREIRNSTGFSGRIIFTNGMDWRMYSQEGEEEEHFYPAVPFGLDDPAGFWDLFMLSMTEEDASQPRA